MVRSGGQARALQIVTKKSDEGCVVNTRGPFCPFRASSIVCSASLTITTSTHMNLHYFCRTLEIFLHSLPCGCYGNSVFSWILALSPHHHHRKGKKINNFFLKACHVLTVLVKKNNNNNNNNTITVHYYYYYLFVLQVWKEL